MRTSEEIDQIGAALAAAQAEMEHATKDATNPHFKSKYADLASVMDACRPALAKAKVAVLQSPEFVRETKTVRVTTRLVHASGQWVETSLEADVVKTDPQAIGSAITYLRRYGLASLASVAADDDDGNGATGRGKDDVRREEPRREESPALREAFEKTVGAFPNIQVEANRVFTSTTMGPAEKLDRLRELYKNESAKGRTKPDPKTAELLKRVNRLVAAANRENVDITATLADYGPLDEVGAADLEVLASELGAILNGRAA